MTNCAEKITDDILFDCADKTKKGLDGSKAVLINIDDIDYTASTVVGGMITSLVLKSGKTGLSVEWFKDLASMNSAFAPSTEDVDGFLHNFLCRIPTASAENAERARELSQSRFVVVTETRYKGALQAEAFKTLGWFNGLKLAEMIYDTLAASGSILYTASTEEGDVEPYPFNILLETDYATTKASFDSLFAVV